MKVCLLVKCNVNSTKCKIAKSVCDWMGGYHLKDYNCQTMVADLIPRIQVEEDKTYTRRMLEDIVTETRSGLDEAVLNTRLWLPSKLGGY
jgi:hypothetical protein